MGHYWREMDPDGAAKADARADRLQKLRNSNNVIDRIHALELLMEYPGSPANKELLMILRMLAK